MRVAASGEVARCLLSSPHATFLRPPSTSQSQVCATEARRSTHCHEPDVPPSLGAPASWGEHTSHGEPLSDTILRVIVRRGAVFLGHPHTARSVTVFVPREYFRPERPLGVGMNKWNGGNMLSSSQCLRSTPLAAAAVTTGEASVLEVAVRLMCQQQQKVGASPPPAHFDVEDSKIASIRCLACYLL